MFWVTKSCAQVNSLLESRHFQQYFSYIVAISFIGGETHRPAASHWQICHIMLYRVHLAWAGFEH